MPKGDNPNSRANLALGKQYQWKKGQSGNKSGARRYSLEALINAELDRTLPAKPGESAMTKREALAVVVVNEVLVHRNVPVLGLLIKYMPDMLGGDGQNTVDGACVTCGATCGHCHPPNDDAIEVEARRVGELLVEAGLVGEAQRLPDTAD